MTLTFLALLVPFSIPIKLKNPVLRQIRNLVLVGFIISTMVTLTPDRAVNGAPLHAFGAEKIKFMSCDYQVSINRVVFCDYNTPGWENCGCANTNARATMAYCYNTDPDAMASFLHVCAKEYHTPLTEQDFHEALSNYSRLAKPLSEVRANTSNGTYNDYGDLIIDFPLRINDTETQIFLESYNQFLGNYDRSIYYGGFLVLYWVVVFVVISLFNWSKLVVPSLHKRVLTDSFSNWFRKTVTVPATGGKRKTNEKPFMKVLDMLVPTRLETIVLTGFFLLTAYFAVINIHYVEGDPVFKSKYRALLRFYAVRTSILTSSMMPLLILFGGRNNFLQWLTRWDYSTFITFHRWISRVLVLMIVIHSLFYTLYDRDFSYFIREGYVQAGLVATTSGIVILVQGLLVLRRKWYECFLLIHIILACGFIFGAYVHVSDLYCLWFYHYTVAVWAFDRLVRLGRLFSFGFPKAQVFLLADESLKVVVPKPYHWQSIPGGHVFIHFLRPGCFWQSHPFTYTNSIDNNNEIILFIKVKLGVTQDLYNYLKAHPGRTTSIRVAVEGSYGEHTPARHYETSVFVSGGNGIPGIYAEAIDLALANVKLNIKLAWVVREYRSLLWFYEELMSLRNTKIETTIYVTKPDSHSFLEDFNLRFATEVVNELQSSTQVVNSPRLIHSDESSDESTTLKSAMPSGSVSHYGSTESVSPEEIINKIKRELSFITFKEGRPSMDLLVKDTIKESPGACAYITCGHPVMVDDLRLAVVNNIDNAERKRIDYYEQLQVWA